MMTYFEVKRRLETLVEFRRLYAEYMAFINRASNPAAQLVRAKLEPLAPVTVDSLRRVGLGSMLTKDAPSRGGKTIRINLIRAIFRDRIIRHFSLDERAPLEILDRGITRYQTRLWRQTIHLFNPLFWLYHFSGFMAVLPLLILGKAGHDTQAAEQLSSVRLYVVLFQVVFLYVILKSVGFVGWFWSNLL